MGASPPAGGILGLWWESRTFSGFRLPQYSYLGWKLSKDIKNFSC